MADYIWGGVFAPNETFLEKAVDEPVLEPDIPIVDAHAHLWHLPDSAPYFLPQYAKDLAGSGHNVVASVFVECNAMYRQDGPAHLRCVGETRFVVGQAAMADNGRYTRAKVAAGIVGGGDLRLGDRVDELLDAHLEASDGRFRGIRQRAKWDADPVVKGSWSEKDPYLYLDPAFNAGMRRLAARGLSFDASIYHPQLPDVTALATAHPDVAIVLNHVGSPVGHASYTGRAKENFAFWTTSMRELAKRPNVAVKLGGLLMNLATFDFSRADRPPTSEELVDLWRPHLETCIDVFGPDRCMVSSNFPVEKCAAPLRTFMNMFKRIAAPLSESEKGMLFSGTASRVYRLG